MTIRMLIGFALVAFSLYSFLLQWTKVRKGQEPAQTLVNEGLRDLGLLFLGLAQLWYLHPVLRDVFFAGCIVMLVVYLVRRYLWPRLGSSSPDS